MPKSVKHSKPNVRSAVLKLRRNLFAAALILALHAGLLALIVILSPPTPGAATHTAPVFPSTVVMLLAALPPEPPPQQKPAPKPKLPQIESATQSRTAPSPAAALTLELPTTGAATAVTLPTAPAVTEGKPTPVALNIGIQSLQSAAREADKNSVRRLASQSGKMDELETATPNPIALVAAESSVPRCPPKEQLREAVGPQGYALTRDRSGDCEYERKAKVRALALGR